MRYYIIFLLLFISVLSGFSTNEIKWTEQELNKANTGASVNYLSQVEKDVLKYLNLARLYPLKFYELELKSYFGPQQDPNYLKGSSYRRSLIKELKKQKPVNLIQPDSTLSVVAECLAEYQAKTGKTGHKRKGTNCSDDLNAECCSYGVKTGKEIIMQLLIDHDVKSLGHREILLSDEYKFAGIAKESHKKLKHCCVIDLK